MVSKCTLTSETPLKNLDGEERRRRGLVLRCRKCVEDEGVLLTDLSRKISLVAGVENGLD